MLGQLDSHMQKNKLGSLSNAIDKIKSEWIKDLDSRAKTINLSVGVNIHDLEFGKGFLYDVKSMSNRRKK